MQGMQPPAEREGALTMRDSKISWAYRGKQRAEVMRALSFSHNALNWLWAGDVRRAEGREN